MNAEELYTIIESYLNGELAGEAFKNFESRLNTDPEFAEEVKLHQSLHAAMDDPKKRNLRDSLGRLRQEFKNAEAADEVVPLQSNRFQRRLWMAAASLLLLALAWWAITRTSAPEDRIVNDPKIEDNNPIPDNEDDKKIEDAPNKKVIPTPKEKEQYAKEDSPKQEEPDSKQNPQQEKPTFDHYKVNTELATLIDKAATKEKKTHRFKTNTPAQNETLMANNGEVPLYFSGDLQSFDFPEKEAFKFTLYDNQVGSFSDGKFAYQGDIDFTKVEGDLGFAGEEFTFLVDEKVKLQPGRYYYVIRLGDSNEVLTGGSFLVR